MDEEYPEDDRAVRAFAFLLLLDRIEAGKRYAREIGGTVLIVRDRETGVVRVCLGVPRDSEITLAEIGPGTTCT